MMMTMVFALSKPTDVNSVAVRMHSGEQGGSVATNRTGDCAIVCKRSKGGTIVARVSSPVVQGPGSGPRKEASSGIESSEATE